MMRKTIGVLLVVAVFIVAMTWRHQHHHPVEEVLTTKTERRSLAIDVLCVGELEAAHSTIISSSIRGEQPQIIDLIKDGETVQEGTVLAQMDPTPFEGKILELQGVITEQESLVETCKQTVEADRSQCRREEQSAALELESTELELEKVVHGDGPQEESRLKAALTKARVAYEEVQGYLDDLEVLEKEGYLNKSEVFQALKKVDEAKEAFETAEFQYSSFHDHVFPMQVKKAETQVRKQKMILGETEAASLFKIMKAEATLKYAEERLKGLQGQRAEAERALEQTTICAPASGMVVLRDQYFQGQKRKARIGDHVHTHQALIDLPDLSSMIVMTKVREIDLHKIDVGKATTVEVDAYPRHRFSGEVLSIGVLAEADPRGGRSGEKTFQVSVAIENPGAYLRPGMTARVAIHAEAVDEALVVPVHAVFYRGGSYYCCVASKEGQEGREGKEGKEGYLLKPVEVGASNETWAQIVEGLEVSEEVCLSLPDIVNTDFHGSNLP